MNQPNDTFIVQTTSSSTANVADIWLAPPDDVDSATTRRVARAQLVDNAHSSTARVKLTVVHQRRHSKREMWQDYETFNYATLKAGQEMKLSLNAFETYHLFQTLERLHKVTEDGIPQNDGQLKVIDESEEIVKNSRVEKLVAQMIQDEPEEFWEALRELKPDMIRAVTLTKLHQIREEAVNEFECELNKEAWDELDWQKYFERNTWIFGYGLTYRFLSTLISQPQYGGVVVTGSGGQRGDFLSVSEAATRFTVLIEIKRPDSQLVKEALYRNKVHMIGGDLIGGVTQLQSNCNNWEMEGAQSRDNREFLESLSSYTVQPKGILIIGNTNQLNSGNKRTTFELFRRSTHNPEVITFDELLARAKHLLLNDARERHSEDTADSFDTVERIGDP